MHIFFPLLKAVLAIELRWITDNRGHPLPSSTRNSGITLYSSPSEKPPGSPSARPAGSTSELFQISPHALTSAATK